MRSRNTDLRPVTRCNHGANRDLPLIGKVEPNERIRAVGNRTLVFWKVNQPTQTRWTGKEFIKGEKSTVFYISQMERCTINRRIPTRQLRPKYEVFWLESTHSWIISEKKFSIAARQSAILAPRQVASKHWFFDHYGDERRNPLAKSPVEGCFGLHDVRDS
jgi:hypothetical protein